jgi:hypothetical protein
MALFDLGSKIGVAQAVAPQTLTANANSFAVDTEGFQSVAFVTTTGAGTVNVTNCFTASYLESDDSDVANASAIAAARVISTVAFFESNASVVHSVVPTKQYVFQRITETGTASQLVATVAVLGDAAEIPVS